MTADAPGLPGHAETAAALAAWVTSRFPYACRPDGIGMDVRQELAVQAAQAHAVLAVADAVRALTAELAESRGVLAGLAGDISGARSVLANAAEELREGRGAVLSELAESRGAVVDELAESRGALVDELTEVRSDLAVELDGIREALDARQLGWRARRRLRRAAEAAVLPTLPDGAAALPAAGGAR